MKQTLFITGTDTGVGKTVLTVLLTQFLRERGVNAAALKPICSGGRDDARRILAAMRCEPIQSPKKLPRKFHPQMTSAMSAAAVAQIFNLPYRRISFGGALKLGEASGLHIRDTAECNSALRSPRQRQDGLSLDEINPWHFRAPVAPLLAARRERKRVRLNEVVAHIHAMQARFEVLLVEGAGGLLSPLGVGFNSRDLILALRATPLIVAPNRLGAVNHALLTLGALPEKSRRRAKLILMSPARPDTASATNLTLFSEYFDGERIFTLPWLGKKVIAGTALENPQVRRTLRALA